MHGRREKSGVAPGARVISLESRVKKGARAMLTVARAPFCVAHHFTLDRSTRLAHCDKCGQSFDAFEAMVHLAEHWGDFHDNRQHIQREVERLREERVALKKEADALRATVRRRTRA